MSPAKSQPSVYTCFRNAVTMAVTLTLLLLTAACGKQAPPHQEDAGVESSTQTRPEDYAASPPPVRVTPEQMNTTFEFDDPASTARPSAAVAPAPPAAGAAGPVAADDADATDQPAESAEPLGTKPLGDLPREGAGDVAPPDSGQATAYDPMYTVQAMNHFVVALSNVIAAQDRIVMDQEYDNIINNYAWGNIESDPEMMSLVERTMEFITLKKLTEEERQRFYAAYEKQRGRALWNAVGGVRAYGANPLSFFLSLAQNSVSAYFRYRDVKSEMAGELDEQLWSLHEAEVHDLDEMRRTMVTTVWPILRQYALPDGQRLSEANVSAYLGARDDPDTARSLREYARLAPQFQAYPPFWHDYALRAQEANDAELAIKCYNTFLQMHRDVLRKDPYLASVCLNKALILVGSDGDPNEIRTLADRSAAHLGRDDGASRLALAYVYAQLGDQEAARRQLQVNIDYGQDVSASKIAARNLDEGRPLHSGIPALIALGAAAGGAEPELPDDPAELLALAEQGAPEAQYHLWRTGQEGGDRWLEAAAAQGYPPAVLESAVGDLFGDDPDAALSKLKELAEAGETQTCFVLGYYYAHITKTPEWSTAAQYYERSANAGNAEAMLELGALLLNEENPNRDASKAREWWTSAAKAGHAGAQRELGQQLLWRGGFGRDEEDEAQKQADTVEGFEWIKRAAEQGDNQAIPDLYYYAFTPGPPSVCNARNQEYARSLLEKYADPVDSWFAYVNGRLLVVGDGLTAEGLVLLDRCISDAGLFAPQALSLRHAVKNFWYEDHNTASVWGTGKGDWEDTLQTLYQMEWDETILYAWDDTWMDTYEKGFCVTTKRICTTAHGSPACLNLDDIETVSVGTHNGAEWILADDDTPIYAVKEYNAECVPFLQELLELRKRMATTASDLE